MVYVLNKDGVPVMPTQNHAKVRILIKTGRAKVVRRTPFTIQLMYSSTSYTQPVTLGVDSGSRHIGLSATTERKELYAADVKLRNDIVDLLSVRRQNRRARRNRKTRYRQPRFDNRVHSKNKGWLAPSVEQKISTHLMVIAKIHKILPVTRIIVETASFDIQKIRNNNISGTEYQNGEQTGFWNVREYVLFRDGHTCQCCKGRSKDPVLNVHHIESRHTGGNAPNNLITLCETCHTGYHRGTVKLPKEIHRGMSFRDAAFMGIMRWTLYDRLKEIYSDVRNTYGYITKNTRIEAGLSQKDRSSDDKSYPSNYYIDARCISGNPAADPLGYVFFQKKVRCHNRQIHKNTILKGGIRKRNQAEYIVKGYRLFDKVMYQQKEYIVFGRRKSGFFDIRDIAGNKVNKGSISYMKLKLVDTAAYYLTEPRKVMA